MVHVSSLVVASLAALSGTVAAGGLNQHRMNAWKKHRLIPNANFETVAPYADTPNINNCTEGWITQYLDHFNFETGPNGQNTFQQRYYVNADYFDPVDGVILFGVGNEVDVELLVNHTGFMWENAQSMKALLVWGEHRYYGQTVVFPCTADDVPCNRDISYMKYLTQDQALADDAHLLSFIKQTYNASNVPVGIAGGSYGGQLSAIGRIKYPNLYDFALASSAPIMAYPGMIPQWNNNTYWQVVTNDASSAGGASDQCASNIRQAFSTLFSLGSNPSNMEKISNIFGFCNTLSTNQTNDLAEFLLLAFDTLAMGNFPYPSNYLTGGGPMLPAFPVRYACEQIDDPSLPSNEWALLAALSAAANVFNNATANVQCYEVPTDYYGAGIWEAQVCSVAEAQETFFTINGVQDMFWPRAESPSWMNQYCQSRWQMQPRSFFRSEQIGNDPTKWTVDRIFLSNGGYDPWGAAGITYTGNPNIPTLMIPESAHHLDLFFTNPNDPPSITQARQTELQYINQWIQDARAEKYSR